MRGVCARPSGSVPASGGILPVIAYGVPRSSSSVRKSPAMVNRPGSVAPRRKIMLPVSERFATGFSLGANALGEEPDLTRPTVHE